MGDKIVNEKYPRAPDLCARYNACFGATAQFLGVAVQELGGFAKSHGVHRQSRVPDKVSRWLIAGA